MYPAYFNALTKYKKYKMLFLSDPQNIAIYRYKLQKYESKLQKYGYNVERFENNFVSNSLSDLEPEYMQIGGNMYSFADEKKRKAIIRHISTIEQIADMDMKIDMLYDMVIRSNANLHEMMNTKNYLDHANDTLLKQDLYTYMNELISLYLNLDKLTHTKNNMEKLKKIFNHIRMIASNVHNILTVKPSEMKAEQGDANLRALRKKSVCSQKTVEKIKRLNPGYYCANAPSIETGIGRSSAEGVAIKEEA